MPRVKVSADGRGVASHAGVSLLREMTQETGLVSGNYSPVVVAALGVAMLKPGRFKL